MPAMSKIVPEADPHPIAFLELLPEIRNKIYGYVLNDPEMDYPTNFLAVQMSSTGIRPSACPRIDARILRTCRQIYNEAHRILYENMSFLLYVGDDGVYTTIVPRGFERTLSPNFDSEDERRRNVDALRHAHSYVTNWKVVVCPIAIHGNMATRANFAKLCEILTMSPRIESIRLGFCDEYTNVPLSALVFEDVSIGTYNTTLAPLRMLRNVGSFEVDGWKKLPDHQRMFVAWLGALITSDSPVPNLHTRYNKLLAYAVQFERCPLYRMQMDAWLMDCLKEVNPGHMALAIKQPYAFRNGDGIEAHFSQFNRSRKLYNTQNPDCIVNKIVSLLDNHFDIIQNATQIFMDEPTYIEETIECAKYDNPRRGFVIAEQLERMIQTNKNRSIIVFADASSKEVVYRGSASSFCLQRLTNYHESFYREGCLKRDDDFDPYAQLRRERHLRQMAMYVNTCASRFARSAQVVLEDCQAQYEAIKNIGEGFKRYDRDFKAGSWFICSGAPTFEPSLPSFLQDLLINPSSNVDS